VEGPTHVGRIRRLNAELALCKAQTTDLGNQVVKLRNAMQEMHRVATALHDRKAERDEFIVRQNLCEFVRMMVERGLE
jgi:L-lactate utilization protein LutB